MSTWGDIEYKLDGRRLIRHAWLTAAGTWAPPGVGPCSDIIAGADPDLVEEAPIDYPASFGQPYSYMQSIAMLYNWCKGWLFANPHRTFGLGGYSQGAEGTDLVYAALQPGGELAQFWPNYIGGFTLGNPRRAPGRNLDGAPDPGGAGISTTLMAPATLDTRWLDCANGPANGAPGIDMYTATPLNGAGQIIRTFYTIATSFGFNDFGAMVTALAKGIMELLAEVLGVQLGGAAGGIGALEQLAVLGPLAGAGMGLLTNTSVPSLGAAPSASLASIGAGPIDAIEAAIVALQFLFEGTGPHVTYPTTYAFPGVTHIQHAIGHVNTCSAAVPARAAA